MSLVFRIPRYFYLIKQDALYILIIEVFYNYYTYYIYIIYLIIKNIYLYNIYNFSIFIFILFIFIVFFVNIVSREHVCMDTHEHEQASGRERERVFHHPVNSSRSELSYPPPTREREREGGSHATAKRGEESARRESQEKNAHLSCHQPVISSGLSAGESRCADRSIFFSHIFSFGCSSAFLPWAEESFGGARAFGEAGWSTTWPNARR